MALGRISPEWFKRGTRNFTHLTGTVSPTNLLDMTSLHASSQLQLNTVCKCVTWVQSAWRRVIRSQFDARSPVMTQWMPAKILKLGGAVFCIAPSIGRFLVNWRTIINFISCVLLTSIGKWVRESRVISAIKEVYSRLGNLTLQAQSSYNNKYHKSMGNTACKIPEIKWH